MNSTFSPGTLIVLVGISGSGKTSFAARFPRAWRVCLDDYREMATDDAADQTATPVAAQIQDLLLEARLVRGLTTVVDSTAVHAHVRAKLLATARHWQRPAAAVLFDLPLQLCQRQNASRARVVPEDVLLAQYQLRPSREQLLREGFADVRLAPLPAVSGAGHPAHGGHAHAGDRAPRVAGR